MLLEFSVKNYRSFMGTQTLSMSAGSTKDRARCMIMKRAGKWLWLMVLQQK